MATYKVIQDVEAEDKIVGPLTLRQFIYAGIAALSGYIGFLVASKGAPYMLGVFGPITAISAFFAFPWGQDQPTEVWALAKIRFYIKPRKRIWDQSGVKDLVTITAPKVVEHRLTNGLSQDEVRSRLSALANTIDSRGWAVKNVNVNLSTPGVVQEAPASDRLVQASSLPQAVSDIDVQASDDMLDETANPIAQHFDSMMNAAGVAHRQQIMAQLDAPAAVLPPVAPQHQQQASQLSTPIPEPAAAAQPPQQQPPAADYWFMNSSTPTVNTPAGQATFDSTMVAPGSHTTGPQAAIPNADEEALVEKFKAENSSMSAAYGHLKTLKTPEQLAAEAREAIAAATAEPPKPQKPRVTPEEQAVIMNLAKDDDKDVATLARQAREQVGSNDGEVVISLH